MMSEDGLYKHHGVQALKMFLSQQKPLALVIREPEKSGEQIAKIIDRELNPTPEDKRRDEESHARIMSSLPITPTSQEELSEPMSDSAEEQPYEKTEILLDIQEQFDIDESKAEIYFTKPLTGTELSQLAQQRDAINKQDTAPIQYIPLFASSINEERHPFMNHYASEFGDIEIRGLLFLGKDDVAFFEKHLRPVMKFTMDINSDDVERVITNSEKEGDIDHLQSKDMLWYMVEGAKLQIFAEYLEQEVKDRLDRSQSMELN